MSEATPTREPGAHSPASTLEEPKSDINPPRSPGSTISDGDNEDRHEIDLADYSLRARPSSQPDARQSLNHVLSSKPSDDQSDSTPRRTNNEIPSSSDQADSATTHRAVPPSVTWVREGPKDSGEEEGSSIQNDSYSRAAEVSAQPTMTVSASGAGGSRRTLAGNTTIGSVYSGNKIRHLKKADGVPLWRRDIQYKFLREVFENDTSCFTKYSDGTYPCTFAEIYVDAMARSSKTSKILKDKLLQEKGPALNMAMVCLLVNVGRMNTTLNFFPEMRAQLRTYHSIPCLQAHEDPNAYKQLQDAPRLKSILKGASEDTDQPNTIEKIKERRVPRTNPVNLIFVLSQYAPRVSEIHFRAPRDFFDLVMRSSLSSASRAKAFLWLMWWYLESDFTADAARRNPFGPGQDGDGTGGLPIKVPELIALNEADAANENVDTKEEISFGEQKMRERKRILEDDEATDRATKRAKKGLTSSILPSEDEANDYSGFGRSSSYQEPTGGQRSYGAIASSSTGRGYDRIQPASLKDKRRSSSPGGPSSSYRKRASIFDDDDDESSTPNVPTSGRGRWKRNKQDPSNNAARHILKTKMDQVRDNTSPAPPGYGHPVLNQYQATEPGASTTTRRPRPMTHHQMQVEQARKNRVDSLLNARFEEAYKNLKEKRESSDFRLRAAQRIEDLPDDYDTEDEDNSWGPGGLVPNPFDEGSDTYGEEADHWTAVLRSAKPFTDSLWGEKNKKKASDATDVAGQQALEEEEPVAAEDSGDADKNLDDFDLELIGEKDVPEVQDASSEMEETGEEEDEDSEILESDSEME